MKQKIIFYATLFIAINTLWVNTIHSYSVSQIEGGSQSLSAFQEKKILVITLPVTPGAAADTILYSLDTLALAHSASLKVIAVPAYEDGYTPAQKSQLIQWYRSKLNNNIIITDGMYTRKTSGAQQAPLFKWLTDVEENEVFDTDVEGPDFKFFANGGGQLFSVLSPQSKISGAAVQKTLRLQ